MRTCIITILAALAVTATAQNKENNCRCPGNTMVATKAGNEPDTAYHFSSGRTVILCGYRHPEDMPATFSEFILSVCGTDTMIDYWDAMTTCRLKIESDTLFLEELRYLPTGKDMKPQETVWTIEKICFDKEKMIREFMVNRQIRKYDRNEVQMVLKEYETAAPGLDDDKMALANKLFLATISGDGNARQYFREFRTRFGTLDGAFSEEYSDLAAMLDLWDKKANDAR